MDEQKLTPWFVNGEKPARNGVYEVNSYLKGLIVYSYWNGIRWGWIGVSVKHAFECREIQTPRDFEEIKWRGLASDPKKGK